MEEIKQTKIPYRPIDVATLGDLISKYKTQSGYEIAVKLLVDESLLILRKETQEVPFA